MGIPKLLGGHTWASSPASKYALPHVSSCIYSWLLSLSFYSVDDIRHELAIAGSIVTRPRAAWWRIGLNVNPDHPIQITRDVGHHFIHLGSSTFSPAREHVDISDQTSSPSIIEALNSMGINAPEWAISSDNGKGISITFHALIGRCAKRLRNINTQHTICWSQQSNGKDYSE